MSNSLDDTPQRLLTYSPILSTDGVLLNLKHWYAYIKTMWDITPGKSWYKILELPDGTHQEFPDIFWSGNMIKLAYYLRMTDEWKALEQWLQQASWTEYMNVFSKMDYDDQLHKFFYAIVSISWHHQTLWECLRQRGLPNIWPAIHAILCDPSIRGIYRELLAQDR